MKSISFNRRFWTGLGLFRPVWFCLVYFGPTWVYFGVSFGRMLAQAQRGQAVARQAGGDF